MRTKPTTSRPIIVCKVRHVWRGMFEARWDDRLNYPRQLSALCRKVEGVWSTGENHPTGCKAGGILRPVDPIIAAALSTFALSSHE